LEQSFKRCACGALAFHLHDGTLVFPLHDVD